MSKAEAGKVYLVGAGPGDPDLLTIKAVRLLAEAGVVLHDDLVPQSILNLAGKQALIISVGKRCGRKKITQAAIHDLMIVSARNGLAVIRLKSGDPMIFGRAAEEIDALREPLPPLRPRNSNQRCRSEQGGGRQGLPGGRRAWRPGFADHQGRASPGGGWSGIA